MKTVSRVEQPEGPTVRVYPPDAALGFARPLPSRDRLVVDDVTDDDVTDDEWSAFQEALAEA